MPKKVTGFTPVTRNHMNKQISVNNIIIFSNSNDYFDQVNWKKINSVSKFSPTLRSHPVVFSFINNLFKPAFDEVWIELM